MSKFITGSHYDPSSNPSSNSFLDSTTMPFILLLAVCILKAPQTLVFLARNHIYIYIFFFLSTHTSIIGKEISVFLGVSIAGNSL